MVVQLSSEVVVHAVADNGTEQGTDIFVPGRLCFFGEHSDWAGGYRTTNPDIPVGKTLVVGTDQGLYATVRALSDNILRVTTIASDGGVIGPVEFSLEPRALLEVAREGGFWSYVTGTAYRIITAHHVGGLEINNHTSTLPMAKGLSSSAAICVLTARAFNIVFDLKLTTRGEMEFAFLGEITTPSKCGRMDQACAFGSVPVAMEFDADVVHIDMVELACPLYIVLVNLQAAKDTTTILSALQAAYPTPSTPAHQHLHQLLGTINHNIISRALSFMSSGDAASLGQLMCEAQCEFDRLAGPLCPSQLTAPVLHKVLQYPAIQSLIYGGKGVGSQGDGTAQLLCRGVEEQARVCEILSKELGVDVMALTIPATQRK